MDCEKMEAANPYDSEDELLENVLITVLMKYMSP
jgi:hypothetical protein